MNASFEYLLFSTPLAVVLCDPTGVVCDASPEALELLGVAADVVRGRRLDDAGWGFLSAGGGVLHPAEHPVAEAIASGAAVSDRLVGIARDDAQRWVLMSVTPQRDPKPGRLTVLLHDVTALKREADELRKENEQIRDLYNNAPCGYHSLDADGYIVRINNTELDWLGYTRDELVGKVRFPELLTAAAREVFARAFPRFQIEGEIHDAEIELVRKDGAKLPVAINATAVRDAHGRFVMTRTTVNDLTEHKRAERTRQRLNRALRMLSECNTLLVHSEEEPRLLAQLCQLIVEIGSYRMAWVGFAETGAAKRVLPAAQFGFEEGYLDSVDITWANTKRGRGPTGTAVRTGTTQVNQNFLTNPRMAPWRDSALQRGYQSSIALPLRGDDRVFGALTIYAEEPDAFNAEEVALLEELSADLAFGIASLRLRAERSQAEQRITYLAHHDPLTELPNRVLLGKLFDAIRATADQGRHGLALLFVDLDNFKEINDSFGHEFGDRVLIAMVERLQQCLRETDVLGHYGGDQFIVMLSGLSNHEAIGRVARELLDSVAQPFEIDGNTVDTTASIGIEVYPVGAGDFESLLKRANAAVYHAKNEGRNAYCFFSEQMHIDAVARMQLQARLRQALRDSELRLHYQPQYDIATGRIIGAEALLRWQRSTEPLVGPGEFIAVAEQSGIIIPIGEWVLNEACQQARAWADAGLPPIVVAANLSAVQFRRGNLLDTVAAALEHAMLPAECLELELTESVLLQDTEAAIHTLGGLKAMGVRLSIDDFGTGYSSLWYLKRLAFDRLKIAQQFVSDVMNNPEDAAIVRAIIQLAHTLQLSVIAEGVETQDQYAFMEEHGCDEIQGYLLGRPVPAQEFAALLDAEPS